MSGPISGVGRSVRRMPKRSATSKDSRSTKHQSSGANVVDELTSKALTYRETRPSPWPNFPALVPLVIHRASENATASEREHHADKACVCFCTCRFGRQHQRWPSIGSIVRTDCYK